MRYVAPGRIALANEDAVAAAEPQIVHDRVDMAQAGRLGGQQREDLLRWLSASVSWPRPDWCPPTALPQRTPLRGPAEFVGYNYRWKPGDAKFTAQGKKGNFPRDDEGGSLVIDNFVQPLYELEAQRLLRQASDGRMVAQLISSHRKELASVLPSEMIPCTDARGEDGVAMRRANWQLLRACGVWKRLRMSAPSDEEENQLARALPYRAERLLWTLRAKLELHVTPAQKLAKQKEQRRRDRIAAATKAARELSSESELVPEPEPEPEPEPQQMSGRRSSARTRVAHRPVLRLDETARRKKAVHKLLRSLADILATKPDEDQAERPPWTAGIRHGMDLCPQGGPVRTDENELGGRRLFGRTVRSAEDMFEAVALGPAKPPQVASLALGKEADDALALAKVKSRKARKKEREAEHARLVAKRAVAAAKSGRSRVAWASGEAETEAARIAAADAAAAAAAAQLQMEEAEALRNAAEAQRQAMQMVSTASAEAAHVNAVPFDKLCAAIQRLGLPLSDRAMLAQELNAVDQDPYTQSGGLMVSRASWLRSLGADVAVAAAGATSARATNTMPQRSPVSPSGLGSDVATMDLTCEPGPELAQFRPLASFSAWKAEGFDREYLMNTPEIKTDGTARAAVNISRQSTDPNSNGKTLTASLPADSRATEEIDSWDAAVTAVDRAARQQAARAVRSYHSWRSVEASRVPPPPPPQQTQQLGPQLDVGQHADALRGYSGWAARMGEIFDETVVNDQRFQPSSAPGGGASNYNQKMRQLFANPVPAG